MKQPDPAVHGSNYPLIEAGWRRQFSEGEVVIRALGWRVRLYAGHSYADRPRVHCWHAYEHRGIVLRLHRGVQEQRVLGCQWRSLFEESAA